MSMGSKKGAPALLIGFGKGEPVDDEEAEEGSGALAGKAFAKAIKSGDGQAIYEAFETLMRECDDKSGDDAEIVDDEGDDK